MPLPVLTVEQMRRWEAASWAAGCSEAEVIRRAGAAVGRVARQWSAPGDIILILAGSGNNGADARHAQSELADRTVSILYVKDPVQALPELADALARRPALIIDGLFGIGLNRPLDAAWVSLINQINRSGVPVLAVDLPSGLHADNGLPQPAAVQAAATVTMGAPKIGLLRDTAWPFVGRLEVADDIGLIPCPAQADVLWTVPADFAGFPPPRPVFAHKGTFGHLHILAGSLGYHGAAVLAARGASRAMPGLITLHTSRQVYTAVAAQLQSVMVRVWTNDLPGETDADALLFGPGLAGSDVTLPLRRRLQRAWERAAVPVIVDASALDWLKPMAHPVPQARILTPHPGEAARMLKTTTQSVQRDRVAALRELSRQQGDALVVLKGHQTLIGSADGPVFVNGTGNPRLAQGGAGDVLAGFLAGLVAQRRHHGDVLRAVRYAVWHHGAAADTLSRSRARWTVEDLMDALGDQTPRAWGS
jgi:NAD(P)H-hydrate epimerase